MGYFKLYFYLYTENYDLNLIIGLKNGYYIRSRKKWVAFIGTTKKTFWPPTKFDNTCKFQALPITRKRKAGKRKKKAEICGKVIKLFKNVLTDEK